MVMILYRFFTRGDDLVRRGVVRHPRTDQPLSTRCSKVRSRMPVRSAHSASVSDSPLNVRRWLRRVFRPCSVGVAHRQLSGVYPKSLFVRSSVVPSGRSGMSAKKHLNPCRPPSPKSQRSQTVIPRPPYLWKLELRGFVQRLIICAQVPYKGWLRKLWVRLDAGFPVTISNRKHPQLCAPPLRKMSPRTARSVPQSQMQFHHLPLRLRRSSDIDTTRYLPNLCPVRSLKVRVIWERVVGWVAAIFDLLNRLMWLGLSRAVTRSLRPFSVSILPDFTVGRCS